MRRAILAAAAALVLLVPADPADAASSAQRFADAVKRTKIAISQAEPQIVASIRALELKRCGETLIDQGESTKTGQVALEIFLSGYISALFEPTRPAYDQLVADLQAIPTNDPVLRSARAAWRVAVEDMRALPRIDRPCHQLEAWRNAKYDPAKRPVYDPKPIRRATDEKRNDAFERKLRQAAKRMRALGVSEVDAERFRGETLYAGVEDAIERESGESVTIGD